MKQILQLILFMGVICFSPFAHGQDSDLKMEGLTAEQWVEKIISDINQAYEGPAPELYAGPVEYDLLFKVSFGNLPSEEQSKLYREYKNIAAKQSADRHKIISKALVKLGKPGSDTRDFLQTKDWFVLLYVTHLDMRVLNNHPDDLAETIDLFEFLMAGNSADPAYPFAQYLLTDLQTTLAYDSGDLGEYLEKFKLSNFYFRAFLPDLDDRIFDLVSASNLFAHYFEHPAYLDLIKKAESFEINHAQAQSVVAFARANAELQEGSPETAYDVLAPYRRDPKNLATLVLASAAAGKTDKTQEYLDYFEANPSLVNDHMEVFIRSARAIHALDNPTREQIKHIIRLNYQAFRISGGMKYEFMRSKPRSPILADRTLPGFYAGENEITDVFYQGLPLSLRDISTESKGRFKTLESSIQNLWEHKGETGKLSALQTKILSLFSSETNFNDLDQIKELNITEIERTTLTTLFAIYAAKQKGRFRDAWISILELDALSNSGLELDAVLRYQTEMAKIDLLSLEANTDEAMDVSIRLLNDRSLSSLAPPDSVSYILSRLGEAFQSKNRIAESQKILLMDPRVETAPEDMVFKQLFLMSWNAVVLGDAYSARAYVDLAGKNAGDDNERLLSQSVEFILSDPDSTELDHVKIRKSILDEARFKSAKMNPETIDYYMAYGALLNADPDNPTTYSVIVERWKSASLDRSRAFQAIQKQVANGRTNAIGSIYSRLLESAERAQNKTANQRNVLLLILTALFPLMILIFWFYRAASARIKAVENDAKESNRKNQILEFLLKDISGSLNRSREQTTQTLDTLERNLEDPKSLQLVDLLHRFVDRWDMSIAENILTAKYLSGNKKINPERVLFSSFFKSLERRWEKFADLEHATVSISFGEKPVQFEADTQIISAALNCFMRDAVQRSSYDVVHINIKAMTIEDKARLKVTISDTGNEADALDLISKQFEDSDGLMSSLATADPQQAWAALVINALEKTGGSYRQILKSEGTDNVLELFFPIQLFQDDIQAANSNLIQHENAQSKGF